MVREQQSVGRGLVALAAVVVLLGGMYLAASFVSFVLLAVFFALLSHPLKLWLVRRGVPPPGALTIIALGLTTIVVGLGLLVGASVGQLVANLDTYKSMLTQQSQALHDWLASLGIAAPDSVAGSALNPSALIAVFSSIVASIAPVVLALAEFGPRRALLVVVGITLVNLVLENVIFPRMLGKGLSLSTTLVFLSFFVWSGLIGAAGALLAMFLTVLVLLLLDSYDETRWLARMLTPEQGDDSALASTAAPRAPPAVRR